jgi:hypothetical protein
LYFTATATSIIQQTDEKVISPELSKNFRWLPLESLDNAALLPEVSRGFLQKYFSDQQIQRYAFQDSTSENNN